MTVRKINTAMPPFRSVLGEAAFNFPNNFTWPAQAVIRQAVAEADRQEADVTISGLGTVQIRVVNDEEYDRVWLDITYVPLKGAPTRERWIQ